MFSSLCTPCTPCFAHSFVGSHRLVNVVCVIVLASILLLKISLWTSCVMHIINTMINVTPHIDFVHIVKSFEM